MIDIRFVSDYFLNEVCGGSEIYSEELINKLTKKGLKVEKIKSFDLKDFNKDCFYLISNNKLLSEQSKKMLMNNCQYAIIDHDPQWCKSNNPALFPDLILPEEQIQHKEFYKKATTVFVQSKLHADVLVKNLLLSNVINLGCNIWSDETLDLLQQNLNNKKIRKYGVMNSNNKNKGTKETVNYCKKNNIEFDFIQFTDQKSFIGELSKTETLVFFPNWLETYNRVVVEARILNCKLISNKMLGCASEPYFALKGQALLDFIKNEQEKVVEKIISSFVDSGEDYKWYPKPNIPKVTVITTIFKAGEFIQGYLDAFKNQTLENKELIIIDANSPDLESEIIKKFQKDNKHLDIKYVRKDSQITPMEAFNVATDMASGEYISCVLVDDRMANDHLEILSKHLFLDSNIDLVYGDCLQTTKPNETVEKNSSRGRIYEHSKMEFSRENMIKSLPGPMPLYKKSMHVKNNGWDETLKHSGDWDLWLKCVQNGSLFKKINKIVGLYYFNANGLSTSNDPEKSLRRLKEEKETFFKYKNVFGDKIFNTYKSYFESL